MKSWLTFCLIATFHCTPLSAAAGIRDYFVSAPDSIFPLLTKNNKLDCLDFMENNMQARIKNKLDDYSEMTTLSENHLCIKISKRSQMDLYLIQDSLLCLIQTFMGPTKDSDVRFYDRQWQPVRLPIHRPEISDFVKGTLDAETMGLLRQLPLMKATVDTATPALTWKLQTSELNEEQKKAAEGNLQPVVQILKLK